ncbi:DUF5916 domain-containing protein [Rhodothermus profundi]|nr:DUF5916 domain-containing protein [Rhodothermus profundi]
MMKSCCLLMVGLCLSGMLQAQPRQAPTLRAVRLTGGLVLDGRIEEAAWQQAPAATTFWQREPHDGQPATERTEVRVLYDNAALYVGFVCYDREPDRILRRLARRDRMVVADWVGVLIDSYRDRKTAFAFLVNAAGTQADFLILNDGNAEDFNWDALWEARVAMRPDGWSAEFRIPFTALRFSQADTLRWGINFSRIIGRKNEQVFWAYVPRATGGFVSRFGTLEGLESIRPPRALQVTPYVVTAGTHWSADRTPQYLHALSPTLRMGGDVQYGLTHNTVLNLTINPDFGQVELDEVVLNLTAFETFYPEKRPFFLEGTSIFQTVGAEGESALQTYLFYSRRIGRQPQGYYSLPDTGAIRNWRVVENPAAVPILGAVKLSGKTANGWAFGLLDALTQRTYATFEHVNGQRQRIRTEPLTNYMVGRLQRELSAPGSYLGLIGTATWREDGRVRQAYTGGFDWRWNPWDYGLVTEGLFSFSRRMRQGGPPQVGYQGQARIGSLRHPHVVGIVGANFSTRDYDPNDVGFHTMTNLAVTYIWTQWRYLRPWGPLLQVRLNQNYWWMHRLSPGLLLSRGISPNLHLQWRNFWWTRLGLNLESEGWDLYEARGAGLFRKPQRWNVWASVSTDERRTVGLSVSVNRQVDRYGGRAWGGSIGSVVRFGERTDLSLALSISSRRREVAWAQNVNGMETAGRVTSVFGRRDVDRISLTLRGAHTFTRDLTLQGYLQWFWARGHYRDFQKLGEDGRLAPLTEPYDRDRYGNPDFQQGTLNVNVILRYEYRPGSTLYVVWTWSQQAWSNQGTADSWRFAWRTLRRSPTSVLLVKWTYTWGF